MLTFIRSQCVTDQGLLIKHQTMKSISYILPDSSQSAILEDLVKLDYDIPGAWSRNILIASGLMIYKESIFSETELKSSRKGKYHCADPRSITSNLNVFPNPAREFFIVEYRNGNSENQAQIVILDIKGRKVRTYLLSKVKNQIIIPTNGLINGTYLIQIHINGYPIESSKVVILR